MLYRSECCYWHWRVATLVLAGVVIRTRLHTTRECDVALNLYRSWLTFWTAQCPTSMNSLVPSSGTC